MKGINYLLEHNRQQSTIYRSPDAFLARQQYLAKHPTAICALKCMDGRLNLPVIANMQPGIIQPWRNLGGKFNLGWPYFNRLMLDWVDEATRAGRECLVLVTYHYSKGEHHRGCRGFEYDKSAAIAYTSGLIKQLEEVFGSSHTAVYPVLVGIETDEDGLVIHGANGDIYDLETVESATAEELEQKTRQLFPDMPDQMVLDFLPLLEGNLRHTQKVRESNRPIADAEHKEWVLAIGRGFDWLHTLNTAFIIGPYSPNLSEPIRVGATLLLDNITSGRVNPEDNGIVAMISSVGDPTAGPAWQASLKKSAFLADFAMDVIKTDVPELMQYIRPLVGAVDVKTLEFHAIDYEMKK
jgi:hypothetical protein